MSSDDPTRRLRATEPAYVDAEELVFRQEVRDRLRSLSTTVALLAVLAVAAIGVAIWALLSSQDSGSTQGASVSRVSALEDKVDQLAADVKDAARAKQDDLQQLNKREQELAAKVEDLDTRATKTSDDLGTVSNDVDTLKQDVDDLQQRVDALESGAAAPPP
jgi:peptidoglycan hydrolase CwlO-like protein